MAPWPGSFEDMFTQLWDGRIRAVKFLISDRFRKILRSTGHDLSPDILETSCMSKANL